MLADLGTTRAAESDPNDSVFVVLLAETVHDARSWNIGSVWLTLGEAEGAVRRYVAEGHKAHHGWDFAMVMEYQTGQLAPKAARHGEEQRFNPPGQIPTPEAAQAARVEALELELQQLRARLGQQQAVGSR